MKRRLVMLLDDFNPLKFQLAGSYLSEKYDGFRCLWLPHTRGVAFTEIPFANVARDKRNPICSGLWTRRGKNIAAPDWWLNQLPLIPLDGELYMGRGLFQKVASAVRKLEPVDSEWQGIHYQIFDSPGLEQVYLPGAVSEGGRSATPAYQAKFAWDAQFPYKSSPNYKGRRFNEVLTFLDRNAHSDVSSVASQIQLPFSDAEAKAVLDEKFALVVGDGGEGVVLRRGHTVWEPIRHREVVKVKPLHDSEAQVVGYVMGQGKYEGMIGALRLSWDGGKPGGPTYSFDLSGLTDEERELTASQPISTVGFGPGCIVTTTSMSDLFKLGDTITFRYNDLTADGIPKFARYFRKFQDEEEDAPDQSG